MLFARHVNKRKRKLKVRIPLALMSKGEKLQIEEELQAQGEFHIGGI
jgi:hypothetical protein